MKANELRIGNTIYGNFHDTTWIYHSITDANDLVVVEQYPEIFKPIPLTEELLLKFGFVECSRENYFKLEIAFNKVLWNDVSSGEVTYSVIGEMISFNHIKHVHQLQNLYFALTGEELTLKQ